MKQFTIFYLSLFVAALMATSSCTKNDDNYNEITLTLNATPIPYNDNNVWTDTYVPETNIVSQNIWFSHLAQPEYNFFTGFVASRNSDNADYSSGNWLEHQWSVMSQGGMSGKGTPYLVASWNSSETEDIEAAKSSCHITYGGTDAKLNFAPHSIYVNNTSYTYYAMLNGSNFSKKFAQGDSLVLKIYGLNEAGEVKGPIKFFLADYRSEKTADWTIIKDWTYVNLEGLGYVKYLYFMMESSDTGKFGMNTPAYFALDRLKIMW